MDEFNEDEGQKFRAERVHEDLLRSNWRLQKPTQFPYATETPVSDFISFELTFFLRLKYI